MTHNRIAVVTDSVACIPVDLVRQYEIAVLPIQLIIDNKSYRDGIDITAAEFYKKLPDTGKSPTSAGAVPGAFIALLEKLKEEKDQVLCITISNKFSGLYGSIRDLIYTGQVPSCIKIQLLDSGSAAAAQGFVALAAARAVAAGKSLPEVVTTARTVAQNVQLLGMLDTLQYLGKSGRVPKVAAFAGSIIKIKPVFVVKDGEAYPLTNSRTYASGVDHMLKVMEQDNNNTEPLHVAVMHADAICRAEELRDRIAGEFKPAELFITEFTPVMGAYTGPGVIAIAFYHGE